MSDFVLVHVDTASGLNTSAHQVAVGIGVSGKFNWTDATCVGTTCMTSKEWDATIDRLQSALEKVRKQGHAKLANR